MEEKWLVNTLSNILDRFPTEKAVQVKIVGYIIYILKENFKRIKSSPSFVKIVKNLKLPPQFCTNSKLLNCDLGQTWHQDILSGIVNNLDKVFFYSRKSFSFKRHHYLFITMFYVGTL